MRGYTASVDQKTCIGCGLCEETLPSLFSMGDFSASASGHALADDLEALEIATRDCPVEAITIAEIDLPDLPGDHDQERDDIEEGGEIGEYKRKHGDFADSDEVQSDDSEGLEGRKNNLSIVRDGTNDD